jgi:proton-translocating NADH-quinone oxidoreductase chain N
VAVTLFGVAIPPILPLVLLAVGAALAFLFGRVLGRRGGDASALVAILAFAGAFVAFLGLYDPTGGGPVQSLSRDIGLRADGLAVFLGLVATGLGLAVAVYSFLYMRDALRRPSYAALLLLMVTGIAGIGLTTDLFNLYVFFELMAVSSYALVAFHREREEAVEAGMKYIVMSSAGSLLALIGIGVIYLGAGTLSLDALAQTPIPPELGLLAAALLIGGFGVKAAVVPMHTWLPDAHAAAPSGMSAMLSGIVIQSGLLAMIRSLVIFGIGPASAFSYGLLLAFLAVLTMTVGNLIAMQQRDIKRMLAYSSVAQMGYILLGFGIGLEYGVALALAGGLFHILNHALMKGGAFLTAGVLQRTFGSRDLRALRGSGRRVPVAGIAFAFFALGLAGVPPTAGFLSKLFVATGAIQAGGVLGVFFVVAFVANSILSLAYYVPALTGLLAKEEAASAGERVRVSPWLLAPLIVLAGFLLLLGVWPDLAMSLIDPAVRAILEAAGGGV